MADQTKRMGRPRVSAEGKLITIQVSLTPSQLAWIDAQRPSGGITEVSRSGIVRALVQRALARAKTR